MKYIPGYEGLYEISENGDLWSEYTKRFLSKRKDSYGYLTACLSKNKIIKEYKIHRLVALSFIHNPENKPQVNHIDGNKLNNDISNLEWCTAKENSIHAYMIGLSKQNKSATNKLNKPVKCIETGVIYYSLKEASRQTGIHNVNITICCNKKTKKAGGYSWEFVKESVK
jgi:hypothetical protein